MPYEGTCLCKGAKVIVDAEPTSSWLCHCSHCKGCKGTACSHLVRVPAESTKVEGDIGNSNVIGSSGYNVRRWFCKGCGSQLIARSDDPNYNSDVGVYIGNVPAFAKLPITAEYFTKDRVPALAQVPGAEQFQTMI